jgi:hypothetical protein
VGKARIAQWEQQPNEPNGAFEQFKAYLALPREDRSIRQAYLSVRQLDGSLPASEVQAPGGFYDVAEKYQWKDRARAFDREADRKIYAKIEAKRAQSLMDTFDTGQLLRERARAAAKMLVPVTQVIGERDGMQVVLVETKMTPGDISRMAQVGLELEQLAAGNPTERIVLQGDADNPLSITVDSAKGELLKRIKEARKRREQAEQAAEEAGLE